MKKLTILIAVLLLLCTSCRKTCRCYRFDGDVDEFDMEDLNAEGRTCESMENFDLGLTYSLCERVF